MRWVLRLIATEGDARCLSTDLIEICRPEGLGDIAELGLTLPEAKQLLASVQRAVVSAQAVSHGLQRPCCSACSGKCHLKDSRGHHIARGDGAASQVSMHRLQSHRDERRLAIALPIDRFVTRHVVGIARVNDAAAGRVFAGDEAEWAGADDFRYRPFRRIDRVALTHDERRIGRRGQAQFLGNKAGPVIRARHR